MRLIFTVVIGLCLANSSFAEIDFHGSLAKGKHAVYIAPIANPLFNETPYITTELRLIYIHQEIPDDIAPGVIGGGKIDVGAAEIRIALNDRFGIIASKDGYVNIDFDDALEDTKGFANVSIGFKYAFINDPAAEKIVSFGIEYEPPTGDLDTDLPVEIELQGKGDGFIDYFVTGAKRYGNVGVQASFGYNDAIDGNHDNSLMHYSLHLNYRLTERFYPVIELNVIDIVDAADRLPFDFGGNDLVNFGTSESEGSVTTVAIGGRYLLADHMTLGFAYERPTSHREDLLKWRGTVELILYY